MIDVNVPTLLLDKEKCRRNIARMAKKAQENKIFFRPHFKTHQSHEIGRWFREVGVTGITVSSFRMARYFAQDGWDDITVAFPVNIREIDLINELASSIKLNVLLESTQTVVALGQQLHYSVNFFIKIDVGYGRTGIGVTDIDTIGTLLDAAYPFDKLHFKGFLTHAGQTYKAKKKRAILDIYKLYAHGMGRLKEYFINDFPDLILSYGDTPSCSVLKDFSAFDELRPGNFVFYDLMQRHTGACAMDAIAIAMACPIVAIHRKRKEIVIYGGGVHFSKDRARRPENVDYYGLVTAFKNNRWHINETKSYVRMLSQEHGVISASEELMNKAEIGDMLTILPIHACMTADLMPHYHALDGEIIEMWDKK